MCLIAPTFFEIVTLVRYPINIVHSLLLRLDEEQSTPIFNTATDTVTDLVNTKHVGNR